MGHEPNSVILVGGLRAEVAAETSVVTLGLSQEARRALGGHAQSLEGLALRKGACTWGNPVIRGSEFIG